MQKEKRCVTKTTQFSRQDYKYIGSKQRVHKEKRIPIMPSFVLYYPPIIPQCKGV